MNKTHILTLLVFPLSLISCGQNNISNDELIHQAYLNVIEATEDEIRPLINLNPSEDKVIWNSSKDKVLLFTLHRFPSSYPEKVEITFSWDESWVCSVKELAFGQKQIKIILSILYLEQNNFLE